MTVLNPCVHRYFIHRGREASELTIASVVEFERRFLEFYEQRTDQIEFMYRGMIAYNRMDGDRLEDGQPVGIGLLFTRAQNINNGTLIPFFQRGSTAESIAYVADHFAFPPMFNLSSWDTGFAFGMNDHCSVVELEHQEVAWTEMGISWSPAIIDDIDRAGFRGDSELLTRVDLEYRHRGGSISLEKLIIPDAAPRILKAVRMNPEELHRLNPRTFQEVQAALYGELGYRSAMTKRTKDGGVDIYAIRGDVDDDHLLLIQCKKKENMKPISVSVVRELVGTMVDIKEGHEIPSVSGVVLTNATFSSDSVAYAKRRRVTSQFVVDLQDMENLQDLLKGRLTFLGEKESLGD